MLALCKRTPKMDVNKSAGFCCPRVEVVTLTKTLWDLCTSKSGHVLVWFQFPPGRISRLPKGGGGDAQNKQKLQLPFKVLLPRRGSQVIAGRIKHQNGFQFLFCRVTTVFVGRSSTISPPPPPQEKNQQQQHGGKKKN